MKKTVFLLFIFLLFQSIFCRTISSKYLIETFIDDAGNSIDKIIVPGRPPEDHREPAVKLPDPNASKSINILSDVPAFDWSYGCSATSAAMIVGYYDNGDYEDMYTGPTNSGVVPMDNSIWGSGECPLSATHQNYDNLTTKGHVDDYWTGYGNSGDDPYYGNWTPHENADCTADYMGTNQDAWGNFDGATTFYFNGDGSALHNFTECETYYPPNKDGCHGLREFFESRGYSIQTNGNYSQYIYGYNGNTQGFTYNQFKSEIDAGRPVMIHVEGHSMVGFGYNDSANLVYLHDTWDYSNHTMSWGGTYNGMLHYAVSVFMLEPTTVTLEPPTNLNVSDQGYATWDAPGGGGSSDEFTEDFEAGLPSDWTIIDADGDSYNWEWSGTFTAHSGVGVMYSASYLNNVGVLTPDNYLITPQVEIGDNSEFSFWYVAQDPNWPGDKAYIKVSTTDTNPASFTEELGYVEAGPTYTQATFDMSDFSGETVYIAFEHTDCSDFFYINIDDLALTNIAKVNNNEITYNTKNSNSFPFKDVHMSTDEMETKIAAYKAERNREFICYNIYLDGTLVDNTNNTEWMFNDLVNGQTYIAGVSALYDEGESEIITYSFTYSGGISNHTITLPVLTATVGTTFTVPIDTSELISSDNITAYQFDLAFDDTVIDYDSYNTAGTISDGGMVEINDLGSSISVGFITTSPLIGSGTLLQLEFTALAEGTSSLDISNFFYNTSQLPESNLNDGSVTVINVIYGDVDDNSVVQAMDASYVLQYAVGMDPIPNIDPRPWESNRFTAADVDENGTIQAMDAAYILQYVVGLIPYLPYPGRTDVNYCLADATISIEIDDSYINFVSNGELYAYQVEMENNTNLSLEAPEVMYDDMLMNYKYTTDDYSIAVCSAVCIPEDEVFLRIPYERLENSFDLELKTISNVTESTEYISFAPTQNDDNEVVSANAVLGNYPNPFNPTTTISFSMAESGHISIELYNIKGQKIKTLINESREAGFHSVLWNGTDDMDNPVSSGVYYYRTIIGEHKFINKMLLIK